MCHMLIYKCHLMIYMNHKNIFWFIFFFSLHVPGHWVHRHIHEIIWCNTKYTWDRIIQKYSNFWISSGDIYGISACVIFLKSQKNWNLMKWTCYMKQLKFTLYLHWEKEVSLEFHLGNPIFWIITKLLTNEGNRSLWNFLNILFMTNRENVNSLLWRI